MWNTENGFDVQSVTSMWRIEMIVTSPLAAGGAQEDWRTRESVCIQDHHFWAEEEVKGRWYPELKGEETAQFWKEEQHLAVGGFILEEKEEWWRWYQDTLCGCSLQWFKLKNSIGDFSTAQAKRADVRGNLCWLREYFFSGEAQCLHPIHVHCKKLSL